MIWRSRSYIKALFVFTNPPQLIRNQLCRHSVCILLVKVCTEKIKTSKHDLLGILLFYQDHDFIKGQLIVSSVHDRIKLKRVRSVCHRLH